MTNVIADQNADTNARFLACTIFKNTILNATKVSQTHCSGVRNGEPMD